MITRVDQKSGREPAKDVLTCPDGSRPRILLAEDSYAARILTTALLTRMGCDVDAAENGEDAVVHAQDCRYHVIIMDIEMPIMDGVTAAQEIRALGGSAGRTPIVALSAFLADSRRASIWRESFDINMAKPAGRDQLRQVIQAVIDVSHDYCQDVEETPQPAEDNHQLLDEAALVRLRNEMTDEALHKLLGVVTAEIQDSAKQLSGAQAGKDPKGVAKQAHKLKGIASTFAAPRLEQLATALEDDADSVCDGDLLTRVCETCACADETAAALSAARAV